MRKFVPALLLLTLAACSHHALPEYKTKLHEARVSAYVDSASGVIYRLGNDVVKAQGNTLTVDVDSGVSGTQVFAKVKGAANRREIAPKLQEAFIGRTDKGLPFSVSANPANVDTEIQVRLYTVGVERTPQGKPEWFAGIRTQVIYTPERKELWSNRTLARFDPAWKGASGTDNADMFTEKGLVDASDERINGWIEEITAEAARQAADQFISAVNAPQP